MQATVLLLIAAVALCSADHHVVEVTCKGEGHAENAAHFAVDHINHHHYHGYQFNLSEIVSHKVEMHGEECDITVVLNLHETKCHITNPKHSDCGLRGPLTVVKAKCEVVLQLNNTGAVVNSHKCETHKDDTMLAMCPDCPRLSPLNDTRGRIAVRRAITMYNLNNATEHYFVLYDVGRLNTWYIPMLGMVYGAEFALVETRCPVGSKILLEACRPLCPDRARHVFCKSSSHDGGVTNLQCETYPAANNTELPPGEKEPTCAEQHHAEMPSLERINLAKAEDPAPSDASPLDQPEPEPHKFVCIEKEEDPAIHTICDWTIAAQ